MFVYLLISLWRHLSVRIESCLYCVLCTVYTHHQKFVIADADDPGSGLRKEIFFKVCNLMCFVCPIAVFGSMI